MYLNLINEEGKHLFLKLAKAICNADGDFAESERAMISKYCQEMKIEDSKEVTDNNSKGTIKNLAAITDEREKKIIVLELIGLAYVDNQFSKEEEKIIRDMVETFAIDGDYVKQCNQIVKKYIDIQREFNHLVFG